MFNFALLIAGSRTENSRDIFKARDEGRHGLHAAQSVGHRANVWDWVNERIIQKLHRNSRWQVCSRYHVINMWNISRTSLLLLSPSFSNFETSTRNLDIQELDYNPSKKDLTDARIHHLLAEELKPYRRVSWLQIPSLNASVEKLSAETKKFPNLNSNSLKVTESACLSNTSYRVY